MQQQQHIKPHPAERAPSPPPFSLRSPCWLSLPFPLQPSRLGKQFAPQTAPSAHYRSSPSACRSEVHPSSSSSSSSVAHLHLRPLPWQLEEDIRILRFGFQAPSQKDSAYGRHMATHSKSYLYLTRPINQTRGSSLALVDRQKPHWSTDAGGKLVCFCFVDA